MKLFRHALLILSCLSAASFADAPADPYQAMKNLYDQASASAATEDFPQPGDTHQTCNYFIEAGDPQSDSLGVFRYSTAIAAGPLLPVLSRSCLLVDTPAVSNYVGSGFVLEQCARATFKADAADLIIRNSLLADHRLTNTEMKARRSGAYVVFKLTHPFHFDDQDPGVYTAYGYCFRK